MKPRGQGAGTCTAKQSLHDNKARELKVRLYNLLNERDVVPFQHDASWQRVHQYSRLLGVHAPSSRRGFASFTYTSAASSITTFINSSKPCLADVLIFHVKKEWKGNEGK